MPDQEATPPAKKAKKPTTTKKKAAKPPATAKPAKKVAAKRAKPVTSEDILEAPVKPKRATRPKKDKGRDLVVDEPGAAEVAAVLHHEAPAETEESGEEAEEIPAFNAPEPKLDRLQKILAKAGISSRRKAEELILGGQVQINGKVVTELGTKADPSRDHIRVDGKLLQGPERLRYFVLNKPKGYVTTVSDPEGRPTVMQFFAAERERLYPVGRLDYLSEGLLLVTNDGELANKLTKAASGVEKTYLVKVAGQPTEDMIEVLRGGVVIEKGRPGTYEGRVRTAPAKIRQVRQGDNPWYEVIIIEGRNRELRKMFEEIGHHVEKIRRIGYGPLILDLEPGKLRELEAEEVHSLHLAAEGKLKTRRRRGPQQAQLPTVAGKTVRYKKADGKPGYEPRVKPAVRPEFQTDSAAEARPEFKRIPKKEFHDGDKPAFKARPKPEFRPQGKADFKGDFKPRQKSNFKPEGKPAFRPEAKADSGDRRNFKSGPRPGFKSASRPTFGDRSGPSARPPAPGRRPEPPVTEYVLPLRKSRPEIDEDEPKSTFNPDYKPGFRASDRPSTRAAGKSFGKPSGSPSFRKDAPPKRFTNQASSERPKAGPRPNRNPFPLAADDDYIPTKTPGFRVEPVADEPRTPKSRSAAPRNPSGPRSYDRPRPGQAGGSGKPFRPRTDGTRPEGTRPEGRRSGAFSGGDKPFRPRNEGARPSSYKPFRPTGPAGPAGDDRPRPSNSSAPKKFAGARPAPSSGFQKSGQAKPGPDGEPRKKERWRNSFTGKNKGRPKPKA